MPPGQQNNQSQDPYEFITNPPQQKKKLGLSFGDSPVKRAVLIAVGLILIIISFMVISSMLNSASDEHKKKLAELAQTQTEIIRVSATAEEQSSNINTRQFAATTSLSLQSDLNQTNTMLARRGIELESKTLSQKENPKTNSTLEQAFSNNRFDEAFIEILEQYLEDYQILIRNARTSAAESEQESLAQDQEDVGMLIKQAKNLQ